MAVQFNCDSQGPQLLLRYVFWVFSLGLALIPWAQVILYPAISIQQELLLFLLSYIIIKTVMLIVGNNVQLYKYIV